MANELRVVVDTNVCISAVLLPSSIPRQAFDLAIQRGRLLISTATVAELDEVLRRPRFDRYLREDERLEFLAALVAEAELVEISTSITACRDPKDNKFLEVAVSGRATHIITGDDDLLVLNPFEETAIVKPQEFLQTLANG